MPVPLNRNPKALLPIERPVTRTVTFQKSPDFPLLLIFAELRQELDAHEVLVLKFAGKVNDRDSTVVSGDPVTFKWASGLKEATFVGYVHSIKPTSLEENSTEIYCVSPSYLLKNTDQKIYKNVTADTVVAKIAAKYGLKAVTQRHPRVFSAITQAGQSDWQLLRSLAKQTGFALKTEKTTIYFMSKDKLMSSSKLSAPYFYAEDANTVSAVASQMGTIFNFKPLISDEAPDMFGATVDRVVNGIHQTTETPISTTHSSNPGAKQNLGVVVPSQAFLNGEI
jgi:uncharacterized protein involved in type VI secretion and phage assembly